MDAVQRYYTKNIDIDEYFEDEELDLCDIEFEQTEDRDNVIADSFDEQIDDILEEDETIDDETLKKKILDSLSSGKVSSKDRLDRSIQSKTRTTMNYNKNYIVDVVKYAIEKKFFSRERSKYIMSDAIVFYSLVSDVLPIYKTYISSFVFQC